MQIYSLPHGFWLGEVSTVTYGMTFVCTVTVGIFLYVSHHIVSIIIDAIVCSSLEIHCVIIIPIIPVHCLIGWSNAEPRKSQAVHASGSGCWQAIVRPRSGLIC